MTAKVTNMRTPPKSATEIALEAQTAENAKLLVAALELADPFIRETFESTKPTFDAIAARQAAEGRVFDLPTRKRLAAEFEQKRRQFDPIRERVLSIQREIVASDGRATPEQLEQIRQGVELAGFAGERDIIQSGSDVVNLVREAVGGPVDDRRNLIALEQDRQLAQLTRRLDANTAAKKLNLPLQANQMRAQQVSGLLGIAQNSLAFDQALRQQDLQNSLAVSDAASQGLQGLTGLTGANVQSAAGAVEAVRGPRQNATTTTTTPGLGLLGLGALKGVGGLVADKVGSAVFG